MIIIRNKKLLLSLSVFLIAFLFTGCFLPNVPQTIDEALLTSIEVDPTEMILKIGESEEITSVTAYYDNDTSANIDLSACTYESDKPGTATVSPIGIIKGIASCTASTAATITVTYTEDSITKTGTVSVVVTNPTPP